MISSTNEIANILALTNTICYSDDSIEYISIDSRSIYFPEKTLFIALEGSKTSGTLFIDELINRGVLNFLVEEKYREKFQSKKANFFFVKNTVDALQNMVSIKRNQFKLDIIGITGSNGKTIVKEWLSQLLDLEFKIVKTPKSYNSQIGVPLSVWNLNKNANLGIFEAGISKPNEMQKLEAMIMPILGVLTHLGDAHQLNFESKEKKLNEKLKFFYHSEQLIVSEAIVSEYSNEFKNLIKINPKLKILKWGDSSNADILINKNINEKKLIVSYNNQDFTISLTSIEEAFIENISTCISVILGLNLNLKLFLDKFSNLSSIDMRLNLVEGIYQSTIINDSYNADLDSLKIAVEYLYLQFPNSKKTIIISEFIDSSDNIVKEIQSLLVSRNLDQLILIGDSYGVFKSDFESLNINQVSYFQTKESFLKYYGHHQLKNNIVLVKGARKFEMEDVVKFYRKKTHSSYLKVHLNALRNNLNVFLKFLKPDTKIMIMLKAQGYGLGSVEMAKFLESEKTDYFAVAFTDEGIELRNAGIQKPIMILNPEVNALDKLIEYNLEPEIYNLNLLKELIEYLTLNSSLDHIIIPIHLKIETGMHRLGIEEKFLDEILELIITHPQIKVKTILSHLSASDDESFNSFTNSQFDIFERMTNKIEEKLGYKTLKHILNSGGIIHHSIHQYDMVRLGIGLYGFDSSNLVQNKLENTVSLISKISQIKKLKPGESTGYSRSGKVDQETKIGIINLGYADGYHRVFGNGRADVYIHNQYAPTIGNICMDMTMVDLSQIEKVEEGDEVEMIGDHIKTSDLAKQANTIPYEILTSISNRVQRIYWED